MPGITDQPAWDTLRGHLLVIAADGQDPINKLAAAAQSRELSTARDSAAVLDYRIDPTGNHSQPPGPLPWLPAIPHSTQDQPEWAAYLTARAASIQELTDRIRQEANGWGTTTAPRWALPYLGDRKFSTDLALWRATHSVPDTDPRPAGPPPGSIADVRRHRHLTDRAIDIAGGQENADRWATTLARHGIDLTHDDHWPTLVRQLQHAEQTGIDVEHLLREVRHEPLPVEAPAAALYWRLDHNAQGYPDAVGPGPHSWDPTQRSLYPAQGRPHHPRQPEPSHVAYDRLPTAGLGAAEIEL